TPNRKKIATPRSDTTSGCRRGDRNSYLACCNALGRDWHKADLARLGPVCLLSERSGHDATAMMYRSVAIEAGADWVVVVSSLCRQSFSTPSAGRNADALLEGPIEGRLGLVTDLSRHLRHADPLPLE